MMWNILTAQIREEIYFLSISHGLFPEDQEDCRKWTRGTWAVLYVDQFFLKDRKTSQKNLALSRIGNKNIHATMVNKLSQNVPDIL